MILVLGTFMATLDVAIVTVAIDTLVADFDASVDQIHWVSTAYLLSVVAAVPASGWLADRFGGRRTWIGAVALFLVGSLLCGLAWSLPTLIAARVVQGLGGGLLPPTGQALLARVAGPERIGRVISIAQLVLTLAPVLGPPVGGVILSVAGWPWLFLVNVPVGLVAILLARRYVPAPPPAATGAAFDLRGALLLSPGLALLILGLTGVGAGHLPPAVSVPAMVLGAAALVAFVVHGLRTRTTPLIDPRLLWRPPVGAAATAMAAVGAAVFGALFLMPLALQAERGLTTWQAGLLLAFQGLGAVVGTIVVNRTIDRVAPRTLVLTGIAATAVGTLVFTRLASAPPDVLVALSLALRGTGIPLIAAPLLTVVYRSLPPDLLPRGSAALHLLNTVGGAIGTAVLAVILQARLAARGPLEVGEAFGDTFWWTVGFCLVAAAVATRLPRRPVDVGS